MSYATLILGESGTGKTASLRNLDPSRVLLIQPVRKPLPFRSAGWKEIQTKGDNGNIFVCADAQKIVGAMHRTDREIIIIDDWQYILSSQFMARRSEKSYDKFTDIGGAGYDIVKAAAELPANKRVYVLAHTATDDMGNIRVKTLGKLLDDKIVIEGMFTTVLRTFVDPGTGYFFLTQNNGHDTVKSPMGMFAASQIENDLAAVDAVICGYYGIALPQPEQKPAEQPAQPTQAPQPKVAAAEEPVPSLSFEMELKLEEIEDGIKECRSIEELRKIGEYFAALQIDKRTKAYRAVRNAYATKQQQLKTVA